MFFNIVLPLFGIVLYIGLLILAMYLLRFNSVKKETIGESEVTITHSLFAKGFRLETNPEQIVAKGLQDMQNAKNTNHHS